ncbi:MAG: oxidoreductase [Hyphomicrobiales bacterium]|nr:MAG: oxidoreductase [Hyphomicrobiales bacterium]
MTSLPQGRALRVSEISPDLDHLNVEIVTIDPPAIGDDQVLIEVMAAGVNPSDVKASLGMMPHATWPRIPGRDFGGIVREGPSELIGKQVWGGGGELGISRDGTHSRWLALDVAAVREKPSNFSMEQAGSVGVPFITAHDGLREAGLSADDVVLVCAGNGKVGQAVIQLATMAGATVYAVGRNDQGYVGHACAPIEMLDSSTQDVEQILRDKTDGKGMSLVFNTVGSPYFDLANKVMAKRARQVLISTFDRAIPFDILHFFRGRHKYIGIDSLALTSHDGAIIFDDLKPKFEDGTLKPFPIVEAACHPLDDAVKAYQSVLRGTSNRVILKP